MESISKKAEKISKSITWKGITIGVITLLLLIPSTMVINLIHERQNRSKETIKKINDLWSQDQTLAGPILTIPYENVTVDEKNNETVDVSYLNITPEVLNIQGKLFSEERHYGIYKSILYKSDINIEGSFPVIDFTKIKYTRIKWEDATIRIGISDLRGVMQNPDLIVDGKHLAMDAGGIYSDGIGNGLIGAIDLSSDSVLVKKISFSCPLQLKGSNSINFVPIGKTTNVKLSGAWKDPGFTGSFNPEHKITGKDFTAEWNVLHFNRNIPEQWVNNLSQSFDESSFGVNLVNVVDHYQQTERSAKYAIMFISLTFVVFFFVEIITRKRVHAIQYVLVGLALILFYSLLLSISEQLGFGLAYLIASIAVIGMVTVYANSIFKNKKQSGILALILSTLYVYLYVVLQIEDIALLIGSIGLFIILGIIMFVSTKINWQKDNEELKMENGELTM